MSGTSRFRLRLALCSAASLGSVGAGLWVYWIVFGYAVDEAQELRAFVRANPPVPVVFTSRTDPQSFEAAAPEAEGFTYPGTIPWAAAEGRLRLLARNGRVFELTWGRSLPDGSTLVDVMSPSVTLDGKRILFAGRKAPPDVGRWRIYQVNADGSDLKQLTGGADDSGCVALPPLRYGADGARLSDESRKRLDYDDVDPTDQGEGEIVFASSRIPDLGRDHARRATQIWVRTAAGECRPISANRNNDRWPVVVKGGWITWSLWSRNREAVTADGTEVRPVAEGGDYATLPTENWMAARISTDGIHFGYMVKCPEPVLRPRSLFNGRIVFMTPDAETREMRVAQAPVGHLRISPSSQVTGDPLPSMPGSDLVPCQLRAGDGRPMVAGCPSPCPPHHVLLSAAPKGAVPGTFGIWQVTEDWTGDPGAQFLFDDPALVDAEPVGVYARGVEVTRRTPLDATPSGPMPQLLSGRAHRGAFGRLEAHFLHIPLEHPIPNIATAAGETVFTNPTGVKSVVFYGAHRDRFDDPERPRVPGHWEKLLVSPLENNREMRTWLPADPLMPTVLAGLGEDNKVFKWPSAAKGASGRPIGFYASAGDHYSGTRSNGYVFCNGCHTGHTFLALDTAEQVR